MSETTISLKPSLLRGVVFGLISLGAYLLIVAITTPSLPPATAVTVALRVNWWVIGGISVGTGVQVFLINYAGRKGCSLRMRKPLTGTSGGFSVLSSFLSYFALIPLGCCGTWLYIISFLPAIVGTGVSAFLISYSSLIAAVSLILMAISILYTYSSIRKRLTQSRDLR